MTLLRAADVTVTFGSRTLFDRVEFVIEAQERVGLVGLNGTGKSTLMKVLTGVLKPDSGVLQIQRGARVEWLPQEPTFPDGATVASELEVAQAPLKAALDEHTALSALLSRGEGDDATLARLSELSESIERHGGWDTAFHARKLLDRLGVKDWERPIAELSGGLKKRVAIARALLAQPDLLMLDEPTNHLDADTVSWLEDELDGFGGALLLVTHDRYFLDGLVDRIVEVNAPGTADTGLVSYPGNYEAYLEQKMVSLENASVAEHKRQRWIAQEVAWLRKGVEARRTKSKARIDRARKLLTERGFVRPKVPDLQVAEAPRLSQTVIEAKKVGKRFGERTIFSGVDLIVQPGERIGIVGPNGVGKTTLLRTLLGELSPDSGTVTIGPRTKVAYYDQQRTQLDDEATVAEAVWSDDWVMLGQQKVRLSDYLDDLGFPVPAQKQRVKALSGGERNRLLLARVFLEGANVLVLDEPTNDLDLQTLNVLERLLRQFEGVVLLVTHDRYFLDKIASSILALEGDGRVTRYEGNWTLYRKLRGAPAQAASSARAPKAESAPPPALPKKGGRLSYKDQRELDGMEAAIEAAETAKATLERRLADPSVLTNAAEVARLSTELDAASHQVERLYARWQALQSLVEGR
ncbi:MAG: ABC-F family ATP-binding cassette domain-containing protein [Myxococcaceae bacterium]|nr:ABC-F family ATP-binding cassette domain-containing protein [Myxococcaceae bacterium]